jgi:hypothetical protein
MRRAMILAVGFVAVGLVHPAWAEKTKRATRLDGYRIGRATPQQMLYGSGNGGPTLSSAVADTFHLAWYNFEDQNGNPSLDGWTPVDINVQYDVHWQVETFMVLSGSRSMWCGRRPSGVDPYCSFDALPGYGNGWDQLLCSEELAESVCVSFEIFYESEEYFDETYFQWSDDNENWTSLATLCSNAGVLDTLEFYVGSGTGSIWLRFRFFSDGNTSDEDGLLDTDGACRLDNIRVQEFLLNGTPVDDRTSTFESEVIGSNTDEHGIWTGKVAEGFGTFGAVYSGMSMVQEDECVRNISALVAFIDPAADADYACGGWPGQKVTPYHTEDGLYMFNEIWSPPIANVGAGTEYRFIFDVYRDTKLNALVLYVWHVRNYVDGCWWPWRDTNNLLEGPQEDWFRHRQDVSPFVDPTATQVQLALGAWDTCPFFCGIYGDGSCHSHGPLFDNVHLVRVNPIGPQFQLTPPWYIQETQVSLFQDTFAEDGTTTGHARADVANDILPNTSPTPGILPGDSLSIRISNVGPHPGPEGGPAVYAYVSVWPPGQIDKSPQDLQAPETAQSNGEERLHNYIRYPYINTITHDGVEWHCFRMDSATDINSHEVVEEIYCFDLNDWVLTPGDTICYVICASDSMGNSNYFSRRHNGQGSNFFTDDLWDALSSPMEFTILPAGGWARGGDILYVDKADGATTRDGFDTPVQRPFDIAFEHVGISHLVDRFDVLGAPSVTHNSLGSRVTNIQNQIIGCYRTIIWSTGDLTDGLIGDGPGGNDDKSNDGEVLYDLLNLHPDNPGLYITGDNIAEEWPTYVNEAQQLRSDFINHTLDGGDHIAAGEPTNPLLEAVGPCFVHAGVPDSLIAYGGCPAINDFDLLTPVAPAVSEWQNPSSGRVYVISQTTPNNNGSTARVVLSGFGWEQIKSTGPGFPPARTHHLRDILVWLGTLADEPTGPGAVPYVNSLSNNYPNPFNPTTVINYSIQGAGPVTLKVYNVAGQLVRTLVNEVKMPQEGGFSVTWDGRDNSGVEVASGVYFYRMTAKGFEETKKMVLLK